MAQSRDGVAVEAQGLTVHYGQFKAVDGLSIQIRTGEIFGLLGHNGAGKTTAVRTLAGLLRPTAGWARVNGLDPQEQGPQLRKTIGVSTESPAVDERMTGEATLAFFAELYDLPPAAIPERIGRLLERFDLVEAGKRRVGEYSKGMRQRLALARALLHDPAVLFFDEPTSGLDPVATRQTNEGIIEMTRGQGKTVILCTHNLTQAQQLCDRVAVLEHGRVIAVGTPHELARDLRVDWSVIVEIDAQDLAAARRALAQLPGVEVVDPDTGGGMTLRLELLLRDGVPVPRVVAHLAAAQVGIHAVVPDEATLEDVYFALQEVQA